MFGDSLSKALSYLKEVRTRLLSPRYLTINAEMRSAFVSDSFQTERFLWLEPNLEQAPPLHITDRGVRYPTVTGVAWLSEYLYVAAHRCGLKLALFDSRDSARPVCAIPTPHRVDDVAAIYRGDSVWEISVSGCWDAVASRFVLNTASAPQFILQDSIPHRDRTFSHGVSYDFAGNLCVALHTGSDPRVEIGTAVSRLPRPWGPRRVCFDEESKRYYAVAVSANPKRESYKNASTSIWSLDDGAKIWRMQFLVEGVHSDACQIYRNRIWIPDQRSDRILGLSLVKDLPVIILAGGHFDFPHGLSISKNGNLAVTNYGDSSIVTTNLNTLINRTQNFRQIH